MRRKIATNDHLIDQLIDDPHFKIKPCGEIFTCIDRQGHVQPGTWRPKQGTHEFRGKLYRRIRYQNQFLFVHRIIYRKFIGILDSYKVVNHIDGDGLNNSIENLELISKAKNNLHRFQGEVG